MTGRKDFTEEARERAVDAGCEFFGDDHRDSLPNSRFVSIVAAALSSAYEQGGRETLAEQKLSAALERVEKLAAVLDGFRCIGFKPCKDPACYRSTLEMMQRSNDVLCDIEDAMKDSTS